MRHHYCSKPKDGLNYRITKSASLLLALFILFQPLTDVFAAKIKEVPPADTVAEKTSEKAPAAKGTTAPKKPTEEPVTTQSKTVAAPQSLSTLTVPTGETGELTATLSADAKLLNALSVDKNTGNLNYTYDFTLPNGRGVTSPKLALSYSSQSASDSTVFGYGWDISIPFIERINKVGAEVLYSTGTPYYRSSLSGELVQVGSTSVYQAKIESGDFLQYTKVLNGWEVTDKVGTKYYFGTTAASRKDSPTDANKIAGWMLDKSLDTNGNFTTYTYSKDSGMIYPYRIQYTNTATSTGIFQVQFSTTSTDHVLSYRDTFPATKKYRISEVSVSVSGNVVRSYAFRYEKGLNEHRDLLAGITETGIDGATVTARPEIIFNYDASQLPSWTTNNAVDFPEPLTSFDNGVRFADMNGDGLTDVVRYSRNADYDTTPSNRYDFTLQRVHINKGDGNWDIDVDWDWDDIQVPFVISEDGLTSTSRRYHDLGTRLVDVNGDGRDDLVVAYSATTNYNDYSYLFPSSQLGVYLNTGSGFKRDENWSGLLTFSEWNVDAQGMSNNARVFADINGDGLPEIVTSYFYSESNGSPYANTISSVKLNTGHSWIDSNLTFPAALGLKSGNNGHRTFSDTGTRILDVNGDGLMDVLRGFRNDYNLNYPNPQIDEQSVYLNTGSGWATTTAWSLPATFVIPDLPAQFQSYHLVDINGDRLADIIKAYCHNNCYYELHLNTGNGWEWKNYQLPFLLNSGYRALSTGKAFVDFDGDTIVDVLDLNYSDSSTTTQMSGGGVIINNVPIPDILTGITLENGGGITIMHDGYLDTVQQTPTSIGDPVMNPTVVSSISYDSGFGNTWTSAYAYKNGHFNYSSSTVRDRRFAGFGVITQTDENGAEANYYHQGNGNNATTSETGDEYAKIGRLYKTETQNTSGNIFTRTYTSWSTSSSAVGSTFVRPQSVLIQDYDGNSTHKDTAQSFAYSSTNGNLLSKTEWGEVSGSLNGTFSDTGTDKRTSNYTYATNTTANIISLPSSERLDGSTGAKIAETRYYYDALALGAVNTGNLTKREQWVTGATYASTQWTYNPYGLPLSEINARGFSSSISYDPYTLYPATTTNSLSQSTRYTYDYSSGKVRTVVDPNNFTHETIYDGLDRVLESKEPRGANGALVTTETNTYTDTPGSVRVYSVQYMSPTSTVDTYQYFDGFGRKIQSRRETETTNQYAVSDMVYGARGLVASESLPYFSTGTARTPATNLSKYYTSYTYDPLNRKVSVGTILGTTVLGYDEWKETVTDPLAHSKSYTRDAFTRLESVREQNNGTTYTTTYAWTPHNQLATVTDALGNIRAFTYDALGRRISAQDLHAPGDTTFGTWSFAYDLVGNRATTTSPKSQTTVTTYDALNRPTTENFTGAAGIEATFTYDTCTNGKGLLCTTQNSTATTTRTYTASGLIASETKTIGGVSYPQSTTYDYQNNQVLSTYPDNSEVAYTYNAAGQLETVRQRESGGQFQDIVSNFDYAPTGQVTYELRGNGVSTSRTYDDAALYRLKNIVTTATLPIGGPGDELRAAELLLPPSLPQELLVEGTTTPQDDVLSIPAPEEENVPARFEIQLTESAIDDTTSLDTMTTDAIPLELSSPQQVVQTLQKKSSGSRIKNVDDAKSLRKYHKERVAYLKSLKDLPKEALDAALYAENDFESILVRDAYITKPGDELKDTKESIVSWLWGTMSHFLSYLLPEKAYAYLFGKESFESCGALPCSFNTNASWGSVAASLDTTSKVVGTTSVKAVVTGEGSASLSKSSLSSSELWIQLKVFIPSPLQWGPSGYFSILSLTDTLGANTAWLNVENYGNPRLTLAGNLLSYTDTGLNLIPGATNTLEIRVKTGSGTGDIDIWLNNSVQASPNFNGSGALTIGTANINIATLGMQYAPENGISTTYYDDIVIDTSFIGAGVTNTAPSVPTVLLTEGVQNPTNITDITPEFSAIYQDADTGDNATHYQIQVGTSSSFTTTLWDTSQTALPTSTPRGTRTSDISYSGSPLTPATQYYWRMRFWDTAGAQGAWSTTTATFTVATSPASNTAPTAPSVLLAEGQTNPTNITDATPEFSALFNDGNAGDSANKYRVQVSPSASFTSLVWDSGTTTMATTSVGVRSADISYAGGALASSTPYYWRILFVDVTGAPGVWSTSTATFSLAPGNNSTSSAVTLMSTSTSISNGFSGTVTKTWSHGVTGTNPLIVLTASIWQDVPGTGAITSAKWNNVALTKATSTRSNGIASEMWYLVPTTTGTGTFTVTVTGNTDAIKLGASTFSGVDQAAPFRVAGTGTGLNGTPSANATGAQSGDLIVGTLSRYTTTNATSNRTALYKNTTGSTLGAASYYTATTTSTAFDTYTGAVSADWSIIIAAFKPGSGSAPQNTAPRFIQVLQDLTYTYDAVGNITQIVDKSGTMSAATTTYAYDDLYRLTSASTAGATSTPYTHTYAYNAIGNILSSDLGTYTYASTGYTNPHAVTSIGGTTYAYDQNGNLASTTAGMANTWDYQNRLTSVTQGGVSTTYGYDVGTDRVMKTVGGVVTRYPSQFYEVTGGTTTKHLYAGNTLIGTIENGDVSHVHSDHLGSTNVVSNDIGYTTQVVAYYPFGNQRVEETYGGGSEDIQYVGTRHDAETDLNLMGARYADTRRGQFVSQDPVFWEVGQTLDGISVLKYPQLQNSYSYAGNNPITEKDPTGRLIDTLADLGFIAYDSYRVADAYFNGGNVQEELGYLGLDVAGAATPFATGFGAIARTARITGKTDEVVEGGIKIGQAGGPGAGKVFTKGTRDAAYEASNGKCVFCGIDTKQGVRGPTQSNTDHAIPKSQGGNNTPANAQNTCRSCNQSKGANTTVQYLQKQLISTLKAYVKKLKGS